MNVVVLSRFRPARHDALVRAIGCFTHRYGTIRGVDSLYEYWLESEAGL
jgi:hypothetical protein